MKLTSEMLSKYNSFVYSFTYTFQYNLILTKLILVNIKMKSVHK